MKAAEEYLRFIYAGKDGGYTEVSTHHAVEAIEQAQKDAYNQALEDAAKNVRMFKAGNSGSYLDAAIDTESILKLKKQ